MLRTKVGTDPYMAPEVKGIFPMEEEQEPLETFSLAVDIWSVGTIAFQMVTGELPFASGRQLFNYVVASSPFPLNSSIAPDCIDFVKAAMARSPADRPTAKEALSSVWVQQVAQTPTDQNLSSETSLQ